MLWFTPGHPRLFNSQLFMSSEFYFCSALSFWQGKHCSGGWCPLAGEIFTHWAAESEASLSLKKCKCVATHQNEKLVAAEASSWLLLMFLLLSAEILLLSFQILNRKHLLVYLLLWLRDRHCSHVKTGEMGVISTGYRECHQNRARGKTNRAGACPQRDLCCS